jgi:fructosamine-3-kinase
VSWKTALAAELGSEITDATSIAGGDINDAFRASLADGRTIFVKTHADPPAGMYAAEAAGLQWLAAGPLWIPQVLAVTERALALEWLPLGPKGKHFDEELGRGLAQLHALGAPMFGHHRPSFLATLPQDNTGVRNVVAQWLDHRVGPLCDQARRRGAMEDVRDKLEALRELDIWGPREPPARLHGDLWWGNVVAVDGAPCLIDPAVYGGHREVDLAMLALFGGVSDELIAAYQEVSPLAAGWRDRVALWQLYPLAAHAVLFGGRYGSDVSTILDRFL